MIKNILTFSVALLFIFALSCSKSSIPVGMKCDYLPYAYGTIITSKVYSFNSFSNSLDSLNKVTEIVGDTSIGGVNYCVFVTTGTTQAGVNKGSARGVIRCGGDGIYQYANVAGTNTDLKFLPSNPKLGDTWTNPPVTYYKGTNNELITSYSYEVIEVIPSLTIQGKTYSNVLRVLNTATSTYTNIGFDQKSYAVYHWDKTSGMIKYQPYTDKNDAIDNKPTKSYEELVSVK